MRKFILLLILLCAVVSKAQEDNYVMKVWNNGITTSFSVEDIDSVTFEEDYNSFNERNRYAFHHSYYNTGGACLLASYASMIEWANSYPKHIWGFDNYDVFAKYLVFHNSLEPVSLITASQFRNNNKDNEEKLSKAINGYCISRNWSGYVQVENFHNWLKSNSNWVNGIEIVDRLNLENRSQPIANSYDKLLAYFKNNTLPGKYDYVALVIIGTTSGPHSILLGYDAEGHFLKDPNYTDKLFDPNNASFGFSYSKSAVIYEALVFRVKRAINIVDNTNVGSWYSVTDSQLGNSGVADDKFIIAKNKHFVKKIRLDMSAKVGKDGTNAYTVVRLSSASNPNTYVQLGHFYSNGMIRINGKYFWGGTRIRDSIYEFDLSSFASDFYISHYQPNFNLSLMQIQN